MDKLVEFQLESGQINPYLTKHNFETVQFILLLIRFKHCCSPGVHHCLRHDGRYPGGGRREGLLRNDAALRQEYYHWIRKNGRKNSGRGRQQSQARGRMPGYKRECEGRAIYQIL